MADTQPNFDQVARPYRWLEYLSFGPFLERCRFHFLGQLNGYRSALVLGDGDGRFTAKLLATNRDVTVEAVDSSAEMLRLLSQRVASVGRDAKARLRTVHADALAFTPETAAYDLVATHFFLDCLSESEITALIGRITPQLVPGVSWLVSEFAHPPHQPAAFFSRLLIATLYRAFGLLTGLRVRSLPDYTSLLNKAGFSLSSRKSHLCGLLVSELWRSDPQAGGNHPPVPETPTW